MGCPVSRANNTGLYDDHELLDNLNFENEDNNEMAWEDDVLIAAADNIVGINSNHNSPAGAGKRAQSRILTTDEIQRITREKMARIVEEQQHNDVIIDAALAQADEDQRLEEEAEIQMARLKVLEESKKNLNFETETFDAQGVDTNDEDFEDFLEDVKSKSLQQKMTSLTIVPSRQDVLNDTVVSAVDSTLSFADAEDEGDFEDLVADSEPSKPGPVQSESTSATLETNGPLTTSMDGAPELSELDLPDLKSDNALAASNTDFAFA